MSTLGGQNRGGLTPDLSGVPGVHLIPSVPHLRGWCARGISHMSARESAPMRKVPSMLGSSTVSTSGGTLPSTAAAQHAPHVEITQLLCPVGPPSSADLLKASRSRITRTAKE